MEAITVEQADARLSKSFILMMALTCGICAGANFYNQPLIYSIARSIHEQPEQVAWMIVIGQLSFALGLLILVPLGDLFEKRRYICLLMCCTGLAQIALSFSQNLSALYILNFLASFFSIATQVLVPFVAGLATPQKSPQVVATLMGGLFLGVLLARSIAGLISAFWSWHWVYLLSGMLILIFALIMRFKLPVSKGLSQSSMIQIYQSLFSLAYQQTHLLRRGVTGGLAFAILSLIFTTMTFILANAPYHFNDFQIGLFGIVGVAGVFATAWAGKKISADQENKVALVSLALLVLAWIPIYFAQQSLLTYGFGVMMAYFALSALHLLNQNLVYRISLQARSRVNAIYMILYFSGAAFGAFAAIYSWKHWGWQACVGFGFIMALCCVLIDRYDYACMQQKKAIPAA